MSWLTKVFNKIFSKKEKAEDKSVQLDANLKKLADQAKALKEANKIKNVELIRNLAELEPEAAELTKAQLEDYALTKYGIVLSTNKTKKRMQDDFIKARLRDYAKRKFFIDLSNHLTINEIIDILLLEVER